MIRIDDKIFFMPVTKKLLGVINDSFTGLKNLIFPQDKNKITTGSGSPIVGQKVLVFPTKNDSRLVYAACPEYEFAPFNFDMLDTAMTYIPNSPIAVYNNVPYIVGSQGGKIGYATFDGVSYTFNASPYPSTGDSWLGYTHSTIDVTAGGVVWITIVTGDVLYALYYDGSWHQETVFSTPYYLYFVNLILNNNDIPYILFRNQVGGGATLKLANRIGGTWSIEDIEYYANSLGNPPCALRFDSNNYPHFVNYGDGAHRYGYKDGTGWHTEVVDMIALDFFITADNFPYCINSDSIHYKDGTGWHTETPDITIPYTGMGRIKKGNDGTINIACVNTTDPTLLYWAFKIPGRGWKTCNMDITGLGLDFGTNFIVNSQGKPYIMIRSTGLGNGLAYIP